MVQGHGSLTSTSPRSARVARCSVPTSDGLESGCGADLAVSGKVAAKASDSRMPRNPGAALPRG